MCVFFTSGLCLVSYYKCTHVPESKAVKFSEAEPHRLVLRISAIQQVNAARDPIRYC